MFAKFGARQHFKQALSATRIKLLYERITLTRFTSLYCFCAIISSFILCALQIVSLMHDSEGISNLATVIKNSQPVNGIAITQGDSIELCSGLPGQAGALCVDVINFKDTSKFQEMALRDDEISDDDSEDDLSDDSDDEFDDDDEGGVVTTVLPATSLPLSASSTTSLLTKSATTVALSSTISSSTQARTTTTALPITTATSSTQARSSTISRTSEPKISTGSATSPVPTDAPPVETPLPVLSGGENEIGPDCIISIMWLNDVLHDTQREDVVLFVFQIWLLVLSFVTILNESIPHLGAGLLGHVLGAAWSAYRVHSTRRLMNRYRDDILLNACNGQDFMGNWWQTRINDAIPLLALQLASLIAISWLSFKLFNVYASQTFKHAGASSKVNTIYKLVLLFSVCLQVSGFVSIASAAMWISKVTHAPLIGMVNHGKLYTGFFAMVLALEIPWLVLGWISVRRESRLKFTIFCSISALMFAISIAMFFSDMYRYIFGSWPFFATMTVTAFILLAGSVILGLVCRLNFGQGLAQHLQGNEILEDASFTPVYFSWNGNNDAEKFGYSSESKVPPHNVEFPVPIFAADSSVTRGTPMDNDPRTPPNALSAEAPLGSDVIPVTRMSVFSKELKRFSVHTPTPSVRSLREDPEDIDRYSSVVPVKALPAARTSTGRFTDDIHSIQEPTRINPQGTTSPMEKASTFSYYEYDRQSFASDRTSIKSLRSVGLPANPRSRALVSDFEHAPF